MSIRTDLAMEAREVVCKQQASEIEGVRVLEEKRGSAKITRVYVESNEGSRRLGKPEGAYITLETDPQMLSDPEVREEMSVAMAAELRELLGLKGKFTSLVVGLGNARMTADALGPRTVQRVMVTRHLIAQIPDQVDQRVRPVSAITPGVLGITGVETGEIVRGVAERVKPDVIIAIDSLAARNASRMASTVQISNVGIQPGSGLGGVGKVLSKDTLGIPVIAVGVPMVVYATSLVSDAVDGALDGGRPSPKVKDVLQSAQEQLGDLVVTPKEVDSLVDTLSDLLAMGLNLALHDNITIDEVRGFFQ